MAVIPLVYKNAVVPIGVKQAGLTTAWVGTGFLVVRRSSLGQLNPFLISNKHVLSASTELCYAMKEIDSDNVKILSVNTKDKDGNALFRIHSNPQVDIAVIPLDADYIRSEKVVFPAFDIDNNAMTSSELRKVGVDDGSLVYMLGFTLGLVNTSSKAPICRLGCISRMSESQINEQFSFLVDIQNFPGNSGSPIILRPEVISVDGVKPFNQCVLVGIVHSYIPYQDQLRSAQTHQIVEVRSENSGIALVHPVEFIRDVVNSFYGGLT